MTDFVNFPLHVYATVFGLIITVLEANRFLTLPYIEFAVKFQAFIEEWAHLFSMTWGRALLYFFEGTLLLTSNTAWLDYLASIYMITLSVFALLLAVSTGKKLNKMKSSMVDMARAVNMNDLNYVAKKFDEFDKDGNGTMEPEELRALAAECNAPLSAAETEVAINILDIDRSGHIDKKEFMTWWKTRSYDWA
eukprot:CAMPEP_0114516350 /NCGR_PEP_ID=MMETSP0109-20121206/17278_1 /TAXON_ID=29199 /ORGANISM="Chlorarachnion reptans, Strain CCCM449" /LENGTH=192 /DNA_ID=CAMNT_0001696727 /DNA_START=132 /DNA_END=710 /DNA_ORIENTATION=-